ncbi:MAG: GNAT family N-acetyltransferase [bacterium]|nr:GNAT family N-acetyltransferase [bacterium]
MTVRRATRAEMPIAADILRSTADWYRPFLEPEDMSEHDVGPEWIEENFDRRDFFLGWSGGDPVGVLSTQEAGDWLYLGYVYVYEHETGRRFGPQLLDHAAECARRQGKRGLVLIAHPEATWATRAYTRFGFERIATKRDEVLDWHDGWLAPYYEEGFELYGLAVEPADDREARSASAPRSWAIAEHSRAADLSARRAAGLSQREEVSNHV